MWDLSICVRGLILFNNLKPKKANKTHRMSKDLLFNMKNNIRLCKTNKETKMASFSKLKA